MLKSWCIDHSIKILSKSTLNKLVMINSLIIGKDNITETDELHNLLIAKFNKEWQGSVLKHHIIE